MSTRTVSDSSDIADNIKASVADLGQTVVDSIDKNRRGAASSLKSAADAIHDHADDLPGGERVADFAHGAANKLNSTAKYIRKNDVATMYGSVKQLVKNNPVPVMIGAAALGFLVARAFSSRD